MTSKQLTRSVAALIVALGIVPAAAAAEHGHDSHQPAPNASAKPNENKPAPNSSAKPHEHMPGAHSSAKPNENKPAPNSSAKPHEHMPGAHKPNTNKPATTSNKPAAGKTTIAVNSKVQVKWDGNWFAGTVRQIKGDKALIHWTASGKDAWVKTAFVRAKQ